MSSAKSVAENLDVEGKLLIHNINNSGPSDDPCGTPQTTICWVDLELPTLGIDNDYVSYSLLVLTHFLLSLSFLNSFNALPLIL